MEFSAFTVFKLGFKKQSLRNTTIRFHVKTFDSYSSPYPLSTPYAWNIHASIHLWLRTHETFLHLCTCDSARMKHSCIYPLVTPHAWNIHASINLLLRMHETFVPLSTCDSVRVKNSCLYPLVTPYAWEIHASIHLLLRTHENRRFNSKLFTYRKETSNTVEIRIVKDFTRHSFDTWYRIMWHHCNVKPEALPKAAQTYGRSDRSYVVDITYFFRFLLQS